MSEWISVDDRLPKDNELVVIFTRNKELGAYVWPKAALGLWDNLFGGWENKRTIKKITYWMPLPEPPKEVDGVVK